MSIHETARRTAVLTSVGVSSFHSSNLPHEEPLSRSRVHVSNSAFTATAVATLVADGRISLDDPIWGHLPVLGTQDSPVRVAHLAYHTSGLWDWRAAWRLSGGYLEDVITVDHIFALLARQPEPLFTPGSRYEHSVSNYTLLAEIVARVTEVKRSSICCSSSSWSGR